ncbi:uncharacterized protein [Rutidosis leptorrhynchoides]|uniref:uncharacterized protein n=1 Tax=Rutidosis leptorrhynchoides TaxID=125765 RepID=UPI003A9954D4
MIIQGREMTYGWPFGLGNMNTTLGVPEAEAVPGAREPHTFQRSLLSFSSFSSSNFDTESTASFFQDNSVSLGRLIGIRQRDNGTLYFPRPVCIQEQRSQRSQVSSARGVCVPNLLNMLGKIGRSKSHSRH